jgi:DNA-3-methyladenine glycosylase
MKLPKEFYIREDTLTIAKELLGKYIFTNINDIVTGGIIVETEAYLGPLDEGSHAFNNKRSERNDAMYSEGGITYMYICYGIHNMLNVVTGPKDSSHAILIRALEPTVGIETMMSRRNNSSVKKLCNGPGVLSQALGLNKSHNKINLISSQIWVEDRNIYLKEEEIKATPRIGLGCKEPYLNMPWRFIIKDNPFISKRI